MQLIMVKLKVISLWELLSITPLTGKFVKTPKKSTIFDHMLLDGHKASFDNFSILKRKQSI